MASREAFELYGFPPILPARIAAIYCSCSRWSITRAVKLGELAPAGKRGRSYMFRRSDLDRWMLGEAAKPVVEMSKPQTRSPRAPRPPVDAMARIRLVRDGGE